MVEARFGCQCIYDALEGVQAGLSLFSQPSRVAVLYAFHPGDDLRVYDPQYLLEGHEPRFRELFLESESWRHFDDRLKGYDAIKPVKDLGLAGLISYGGRSNSVFYQVWFTEHHPDMCSTAPTERWLEHAVDRLSRDVASEQYLYTGISGAFLREYATHAVRDSIVDHMNSALGMDTQLRVFPILDAVLGISRTPEEGEWARGELMFIDPRNLEDIRYLALFPADERPLLSNYKHVRKLLQAVEASSRRLVSEGRSIVGISNGEPPPFYLVADFRSRHGFLRLNDEPLCSFADGRFHSTTHRAKLVQVEELLLESPLETARRDALFKIITDIVHTAETQKHGCTLVVDLNDAPRDFPGHRLQRPLDLTQPDSLELAKALSKVDGAVHIGADLCLHRFACLLDGRAIPGEDRARGARYNSALRFTAEHDHIAVVVVSSDRPVSVIQEGVELSAQCALEPVSACVVMPPTLKEWIGRGSVSSR